MFHISAVNDLLEHSDDHLGRDDPVTGDHLMNFFTNWRFSLVFISDQSIDIQVNEAMLSGKFLGNLLSEVVAGSSWSDMDDEGLYLVINSVHHFLKSYTTVDLCCLVMFLKEWDQILGLLVVLLYHF